MSYVGVAEDTLNQLLVQSFIYFLDAASNGQRGELPAMAAERAATVADCFPAGTK